MNSSRHTSALKKYIVSAGGVWAAWLLLTAIIYFLILGPQNVLMARANNQFLDSNKKYALAQTAGRQNTQTHQQETLESLKKKIAGFVTPAEQATGLMFHISQMASQYQLQNFSARDRQLPSLVTSEDQSRVMENWQELSFSGDFAQVASFLGGLERNQPVIFIENVTIHREENKKPPLEAKILISYLIEKEEDKTTAAKKTKK